MKRCTRCVMDDRADPTIAFDEHGVCNYCTRALEDAKTVWFPNQEGQRRLQALVEEIKRDGKGKKYDCIMGISGGLDSSYLAYLGSRWGLRILGVHVDDGFDTDISKNNIRKLCSAAGIDLVTITPDAEQFNDLTRAYMLAGVPNLAVPQDNVLFACLYGYMREHHIRYFLSGANFALESILQRGNTYTPFDVVNIRAIHRRFGRKPIRKLRLISRYRVILEQKLLGVRTVAPLNLVPYERDHAFEELTAFCGFEYYGSKHLENILTAFIQLYWFPQKFGVDKRTSHLSSMILSGQMSREQALQELEKPACDEKLLAQYIDTVRQRLGFSQEEFDCVMAEPARQHTDYPTDALLTLGRKLRG